MKKIFKVKLNEADSLNDLVQNGTISNKPPIKKVLQSPREQSLKRKVKQILVNDGNGHYHSKFAERFDKDFHIFIMDHRRYPELTAQICFDTACIEISDGFFLNIENADPKERLKTFHTIGVLVRHELLHSLLLHEIRMLRQLGPEASAHIGGYSRTINDLENILMDMEVSNRGYSAKDKELIRNLVLNNKLIGGIVAEDLRPGWNTLTLEQMYLKILEESKLFSNYLKQKNTWYLPADVADYKDKIYDYDKGRYLRGLRSITDQISQMTGYKDEKALENLIYQPIENFKLSKDYKAFKASEEVKDVDEIIDPLANLATKVSQNDLEQLYHTLQDSDPVGSFEIRNPQNDRLVVTLYTPEEKFLAAAVLHSLIAFPVKKYWEERVEKVFDNLPQYTEYSEDELKEILQQITKE